MRRSPSRRRRGRLARLLGTERRRARTRTWRMPGSTPASTRRSASVLTEKLELRQHDQSRGQQGRRPHLWRQAVLAADGRELREARRHLERSQGRLDASPRQHALGPGTHVPGQISFAVQGAIMPLATVSPKLDRRAAASQDHRRRVPCPAGARLRRELHLLGPGQPRRRHPHRRRRHRRRRMRRQPLDGQGLHRGAGHPHDGLVHQGDADRRRSVRDRRSLAEDLSRHRDERPARHGDPRDERRRHGALGSLRQGGRQAGACAARRRDAQVHHALCLAAAGRASLRGISRRALRFGGERAKAWASRR